MANEIMYRDVAEDYLCKNGWKLFLDMITRNKTIVMNRPTLEDKLEDNPELAKIREAFRQALADLNHPEAAAYSHWALEAFDKAWGLRE